MSPEAQEDVGHGQLENKQDWDKLHYSSGEQRHAETKDDCLTDDDDSKSKDV